MQAYTSIPKEKLDGQLNIRVRKSEVAAWRLYCKQHGYDLSDLVRFYIRQHISSNTPQ